MGVSFIKLATTMNEIASSCHVERLRMVRLLISSYKNDND